MPHETDPAPDDAQPGAVVTVTVVRSGGFAGLTRRWSVQAAEPDAAPWIALVDDCPWDACRADPPAAVDRFTWSVRAILPAVQHRADLPETEANGPWRTLIDAVQAASAEASPASEQ